MKNILFLIAFVFCFVRCEKDAVVLPSVYDCDLALADNSSSHPKESQFQAAMENVLDAVPGTQIAVRSKDGNVWLGAQGLADIPNQVPFEKCTKTMVGSVSKMYTAVLIMQLHERGILSIEDPISDWVSADIVSQIENADKVSIQQLLKHTSGIKDYLSVKIHLTALNTPNFKLSPEEKLQYIYGKSADHAPEVQHTYSNSNYVLLGLIIEKASDLSMPDAVQRYINTPLGLSNTVFGTVNEPIPLGTARPYLAVHGGKYIDSKEFSVYDTATGDGGIATNMQEALTFLEGVFNHSLVTEETLNLMLTDIVEDPGRDLLGDYVGYSLGFEIVESEHGTVIGHSGSTSAYWSYVFYYPEQDVTIAVAFNGDTEHHNDYQKLLGLILEVVEVAFE